MSSKGNEKTTKKTEASKSASKESDDMLPEYRFDYGKTRHIRFAGRREREDVTVTLHPVEGRCRTEGVKGMADMIKGYRFAEMSIQGRKHQKDVKIIDGRVFPGWWRREGHAVDVDDVQDVLEAAPEILVIGMGQAGRMEVSPDLRAILAQRGIELVAEPTEAAVATFNALFKAGKRVAGAFHLTC